MNTRFHAKRAGTPACVSCSECTLRALCLPGHLPLAEALALERAVERGRPLSAGSALVHCGAPMDALLVVRSGSAKSHSVTLDGVEQVHGFVLPGEAV